MLCCTSSKPLVSTPLLGGILLQDMCRSKKKVHVLKLTHDVDCCILTVLLVNHLLLRTCSARATMSQTDEMLNARIFEKKSVNCLKARLSFFIVIFF